MSCKKCKTSKCTCEAVICINPLIYMIKSVLSLVGTLSNNLIILEILAKISQRRGGKTPFYSKNLGVAAEANFADFDLREFTLGVPEALIDVLTTGITISNNKDYCCPDCKNGIYYLGGPEQFLRLSEVLDANEICCLEHYTSIESWLKVLEAIGQTAPKCCNTDFSEAMSNWINASSTTSDYFYLDELTQLGLVESSSFNGYSGLGILFDYLQLNHPELTEEDYLNILGVIINLGIVVQCNGCEMVISSAETFLKWYEAVNGAGPVPA